MNTGRWSIEEKDEICRLADEGHMKGAIAIRFGVSYQAIDKVLRRRSMGRILEEQARTQRKLAKKSRKWQSPLADPLVAALFKHHRHLAPESLWRRLLPAPVDLPTTLPTARQRRPALVKPRPGVIALPHLTRPVYPTMRSIMERVLAKHDMPETIFMADSRAMWIVRARQEFCYLAAKETIQSLPQIGRFLGGRDHTTVLHAISRHCRVNDLAPPRGQYLSRSMRSRAAADLRSQREAQVAG